MARDGHRVAVLVPDRSLVEQSSLVESVVAAAGLALENTRLRTLVHTHVSELMESHTGLVQAAFNERRRIERDLHDGLQHRLLRLSWLAERSGDETERDPARPHPRRAGTRRALGRGGRGDRVLRHR